MGIESSITQINYTTDTLPPNIQEAFLAHVSGLRKNRQLFGRVAKTVPDQLLVVSRHVWPKPIPATTITRTYFGLSIMNEGHSEFRALAEAEFCILHDMCHPTKLILFGEPSKKHPYRPEDLIHLGLWGNIHNHDVFLGASVNRRDLVLRYGPTGSLELIEPLTDIYHTPTKFSEGRPNLLATTGGLTTLLQKGSAEVRINNRYSYLLSSDSRSVTVIKFIRRQPSDKLTTPSQVNPEYIISRLFHPETLEDPVNAPPGLDKSWRSANILRVLGIEWSRH